MAKQELIQDHASGIPRNQRTWPLVSEFLNHLHESGMASGSTQEFPGPVKHFLVWLDKNHIALGAIDGDVVYRFLTHDCDCPRPRGERYQTRHLHRPVFKGRISRFVRFLEETGRIDNPSCLGEGYRLVGNFISELVDQRYSQGTIRAYEYGCRHFVTWLHQYHIPLPAIDEGVLRRFATHDCVCPGMFVHKGERERDYQSRIERFVRFLIGRGILGSLASRAGAEHDELRDFREWLRRHRGIGEKTILAHARTISRLRPQLGADPAKYNAELINRVVLEHLHAGSQSAAQQICGALRMYLRFLGSTGACSPALVGAIPRIPRWRLSALPRYIAADDVERVIASCDLTTPRGLRDRAILLLLARLALRAGDVANLRLPDIDWDGSLIKVAGKTGYTVALPLPQDAGDALAVYIEQARPIIASEHVFIRAIAPYKPFTTGTAISIAVRDALRRADIKNANLRGAHLLRHSAATGMVRSGATLDAVGALLRHRSPDTTAIYAKVDTPMLMQVAQPWIGRLTWR